MSEIVALPFNVLKALSNFSDKSVNLDCDHDTETHQWILYETQENSEPAKIIKKFRYKFL